MGMVMGLRVILARLLSEGSIPFISTNISALMPMPPRVENAAWMGIAPRSTFCPVSSAVELLVYTEIVGGSIPSLGKNQIESCYRTPSSLPRYGYQETIPDIRWNLCDEYKSILGYKCQKATCSFRGRSYIAW